MWKSPATIAVMALMLCQQMHLVASFFMSISRNREIRYYSNINSKSARWRIQGRNGTQEIPEGRSLDCHLFTLSTATPSIALLYNCFQRLPFHCTTVQLLLQREPIVAELRPGAPSLDPLYNSFFKGNVLCLSSDGAFTATEST
jgi:hypothetical protein